MPDGSPGDRKTMFWFLREGGERVTSGRKARMLARRGVCGTMELKGGVERMSAWGRK